MLAWVLAVALCPRLCPCLSISHKSRIGLVFDTEAFLQPVLFCGNLVPPKIRAVSSGTLPETLVDFSTVYQHTNYLNDYLSHSSSSCLARQRWGCSKLDKLDHRWLVDSSLPAAVDC